jgi:GTP-binding protein LepA
VNNPTQYPEETKIDDTFEPIINATVIIPSEYLSNVTKLLRDRRGVEKDFVSIDETRLMVKVDLPLAEIVSGFYDKLKSITSGYATYVIYTIYRM